MTSRSSGSEDQEVIGAEVAELSISPEHQDEHQFKNRYEGAHTVWKPLSPVTFSLDQTIHGLSGTKH